MKLSEYLTSGKILHKKAELLINIVLTTGGGISKGTIGDVLLDFGDGTYHFEIDDYACKVKSNEIKFLDK
jgi:hypothetical protein